jgi:NitT/TauT family transport system ATP-binding protein
MVAAARRIEETASGVGLDVDHVTHAFDLKGVALPVLEDVSFRVAPGEFVALLGPSGCGKSTLLRLLAGLDMPSAGSVSVDRAPVRGPDPAHGLVFQDPTLFPWRSVARNVALGLEARGLLKTQGHRIAEALDLVGLGAFAHALPHQLSGGMAQRVALARALVNEPRLFLMDEPLGKLDALTRLSMQGELVKLWQRSGFTALLVTHDVEEALMLAQRLIVFSDRPARVRATFVVDRPYPRHRDDPHLVALRRKVLTLLGVDG